MSCCSYGHAHRLVCVYILELPMVSRKVLETPVHPFSLPVLCYFGPMKEPSHRFLFVVVFFFSPSPPVKWVDRTLIQALHVEHVAQIL